jgi:hypothetical protein
VFNKGRSILKTKLLNTPIQLLFRASVLTFLICAYFPSVVFASATQYSVRFTASYVSGNTGAKNVYYILDGGSSQLLGTVSQGSNIDITFNATFSDKIRVYVQIGDDAVYKEHLYINNNLVSTGNVGNSGLTYTRNDSLPPTGKITSPISGKTITQCPLMITADVTDDNSGVDWVIYLVKYDGIWHQIATDDNKSGSKGWSTQWDCSQVPDQELSLRISARDTAGNQANILGGNVLVTLAKDQTNPGSITSTSTQAPVVITNTETSTPTQTPMVIINTMTPTQTPEPLITTNVASVTQTPVQKSSQNDPFRFLYCSSMLLPLVLSFGFLVWRNRP